MGSGDFCTGICSGDARKACLLNLLCPCIQAGSIYAAFCWEPDVTQFRRSQRMHGGRRVHSNVLIGPSPLALPGHGSDPRGSIQSMLSLKRNSQEIDPETNPLKEDMDPPRVQFKPGDRVKHKEHEAEVVVEEIDSEGDMEIRYADSGAAKSVYAADFELANDTKR